MLSPSMIVQIIDVDHVAPFKTENDPPVTRD
jgi:hypothetical protein